MFNQELIDTVEKLKSRRIVKRDVDISASTGFSPTVVSNYLSGKINASRNFIEAFEDIYKVKIFGNKLGKIESPSNDLTTTAALMELAQANKMLAESMMIAAQSQLIDAESRKVLVNNNSDLSQTLKGILKATADDGQQSQAAFSPIMGPLLELLAEMGVGKNWQTKQEGVAQLGIKFHLETVRKKKTGSVAGAGN